MEIENLYHHFRKANVRKKWEVPLDRRAISNLSKELKGLKVRFHRPDNAKRDYRVNEVGPPVHVPVQGSNSIAFPRLRNDLRKISVCQLKINVSENISENLSYSWECTVWRGWILHWKWNNGLDRLIRSI